MNFRVRLIASLILTFASLTCLAATEKVAPTDAKTLWAEWPSLAAKFPEPNAAFRKLAAQNARLVGSEALMSTEVKTFRDKLVSTRSPEDLQTLLDTYNAGYDTYPNDLKYVVARMTPILAMRGFFWKMIPLAHQAAVTQEALLAMVRNFAEQVTIFEKDSQWQAYLAFLSIPDAAAVSKGQFKTENDLVDFLSNDNWDKTKGSIGPYGLLDQACTRLVDLKMKMTIGGKTTPLVFDNRIRFGDNAFSGFDYAATDRFKIAGDAERFVSIARFSRRMATIAQIAAYNWNDNIKMRKDAGHSLAIDTVRSELSDPLAMEGLTRRDRVTISKKYPDLFSVRNPSMMPVAYYRLHNYAFFSARAWKMIRSESDDSNYALDPELFMGRKEQIDRSMLNLIKMFPDIQKRAPATLNGAIDGKPVTVDMASFFNSPNLPNLHALMPTSFSGHDDIAGLKTVYKDQGIQPSSKTSVVSMKVGGQNIEWRNYLYDRATGWDVNTYHSLFPSAQNGADVAEAQRVLAETRGGRPVLNTLVIFIK